MILGFKGLLITGSSLRSSMILCVAPDALKSSVHVLVKNPVLDTTMNARKINCVIWPLDKLGFPSATSELTAKLAPYHITTIILIIPSPNIIKVIKLRTKIRFLCASNVFSTDLLKLDISFISRLNACTV